jgi:hypothetical protein
LKGNLRIDGAELAGAPPAESGPPLAGRLQVSLDVTGAALTARGLVTSLNGTGEARLTDAVLGQLSPTAIVDASESVLGPQGSLAPGNLEKMIRERLGAERIPLGRRRIPLTVSDGHVRTAAPIVAETKAGRVSGSAIIDLDSQRIDSEWKLDGAQIAPRPGAKPRGALPSVSVIWAGPLNKLAAITPQVQVDALERELSVRRMEGEVDELERLRKLDEDRARQEVERQRTLEAERLREAERARETLAPATPDPQSPWKPFTTPTKAPEGTPVPAGPSPDNPPANPAADPAQAAPPQPPPKRRAPRPQPFNPFSSLWGN